MPDKSALEPSVALAAYAERAASGRRVLLFGDALGALASRFLERGARLVHVCDADPARAAEAAARRPSSAVSYSPLAEGELALREGAFELVVVDNLGAYDVLPLLRKARRALAARGLALIACPNPEASLPLLPVADPRATSLDYYSLYDAVVSVFPQVRMLGQTPFVGYALVDFSAGAEPEPVLDAGFVPGGAEEPDHFIALAALHEARLEEFCVVQLPAQAVLRSTALPRAQASERAPSEAARREVERLNHWIVELEARAAVADERADRAEAALDELRAQHQHAALQNRPELTAAPRELDELRAELLRREAELLQRDARLLERDAELGRSATLLTQKSDELRVRSAESIDLRAALERAEQRVAELSRVLEQAEQVDDVTRLEQQLRERGEELRTRERELRELARTGRELMRALGAARSTGHNGAELHEPGLAQALARSQADLQAADWAMQALRARLQLNPEDTPGSESLTTGFSPGSR